MTLAVSGLAAWYGPAQILHDVSFEVAAGEAVALLGRNGSGKTTTFRALLGLVGRREGRIVFEDRDVSRLPTHAVARAGLGWVPEDRRIFTDLTVAENLAVGRQPPRPGRTAWDPERLFALFPALGRMRSRRGGAMSGGEQQMLTIARTLMGNPSLLLLDEPCEGLSPALTESLAEAIAAIARDGTGILVSEQNLRVARLLASRAVVLGGGRVRWSGTVAALDADPETRDRLLAL